MADGFLGLIRGNVINKSDNGVVLCWVQDDDDINIFELGPNRMSPPELDVDAVRALPGTTLHGITGWFKFGDHNTAKVDGPGRSMALDFTFGSPHRNEALSDDEIMKLGGQPGRSINIFWRRGTAISWGQRLS
jgi:hypothetical protein